MYPISEPPPRSRRGEGRERFTWQNKTGDFQSSPISPCPLRNGSEEGPAHTAPLSPGEGESDGVGNETLTIPLPSGASSDTLVKRKGKSLEK